MSDLIFFTPMLPFPTGHGSSMRASVVLDVLAERHRVFVVHSPIWPSRGIFNEAWVRERAAGYAVLPALPDASAVEQLATSTFPNARFSSLYAFRLAMAPLALRFASSHADSLRTVLDLDDDDVARTERFVDLLGRTGEHRQAEIERAALPRLRVHQKMFVPRFEVNLLAGARECRSLAKQFPAKRFVCLPNIVRPAPSVGPPQDPLSLLFLGSLDYLPNGDAVRYLCQSILPILRAQAPLTRVRIVGQGASPALLALARHEDIDMVGMMPDVTPEYVRAGIVIVPLRAGSGTRIKILEAFSFRRPVISTSIGAEGLDVEHEKHLLIADTPEEFAGACVRLMKDAGLREKLVENAAAFLAAEHAFDRVRSVLRSIYSA
jgi:glycosyltransferase involved in cell wall biosynthesis